VSSIDEQPPQDCPRCHHSYAWIAGSGILMFPELTLNERGLKHPLYITESSLGDRKSVV